MERLGAGRIAVIAAVGMLALSGCQATPGEAGPTTTSSPTAAVTATPEVTETATATPEETEQPAVAWSISSIDSAEQCALFTDAMLGDLNPARLVPFEQAFSIEQHPDLTQLAAAAPELCNWVPSRVGDVEGTGGGQPGGKWRSTFLHIATVPSSETLDAATMFDEFESFTEGFSVGTNPYTTQELGDGTVYLLENKTHGETVPADICHYVEGQTVVTIVRETDGQCVAALERAVAVAKG
ncbi:hypothetical protein HDC34_001571 [Pseudoclavibacter sp. JAI123]|uniref:hypothetical protein n=1 Tax=Pseudoclavibacter sp. JAI123 TaxID=2723065 RepID=UPI0015C97007|nr:hypothetical protein [Pseudoclavibacter sp. JAI123]NYF13277.1 hypothetical protein [Pseudoclavibacter sp. JAI123]